MARVEEAAVVGAGPGTRAAVQEHDRAPFRIAGNFPVHGVAAVQVEPPLPERLDGREQLLCKPRTGWIHRLLRSPFFRPGAHPSYRSGRGGSNSSSAVVAISEEGRVWKVCVLTYTNRWSP